MIRQLSPTMAQCDIGPEEQQARTLAHHGRGFDFQAPRIIF